MVCSMLITVYLFSLLYSIDQQSHVHRVKCRQNIKRWTKNKPRQETQDVVASQGQSAQCVGKPFDKIFFYLQQFSSEKQYNKYDLYQQQQTLDQQHQHQWLHHQTRADNISQTDQQIGLIPPPKVAASRGGSDEPTKKFI